MTNVKMETEKYGNMFQSLFSRLEEVLKQNTELQSRVGELEERVRSLSAQSNGDGSPSISETVYREMEDRHSRQKFLIISGLEEPLTGSPAERRLRDKEIVEGLAHKIGVTDFEVSDVLRIGPVHGRKPRLLRLKCPSKTVRTSLLRSSKNLRKHSEFQKVYINPDLTPLQREKDRLLRTELTSRRRAGESVIIREGRIVVLKWNDHEADRHPNFQ